MAGCTGITLGAAGLFQAEPHLHEPTSIIAQEQSSAIIIAVDEIAETEQSHHAPGVTVTLAHDTIDETLVIPTTDASTPAADESIRWFNGRPIRVARTITMTVTAYSPDERSCGVHADGITASGYSVYTNGMRLVAADTSLLPFGSLLSVPGYDAGDVVPVLDRGGAIKGHRLDVLFATHEEAMQWGVRTLEVTVWEYADGRPDDFRTNHRRR